MNNGKLQAKQEKLNSLYCPSPQSSLFNSRDSLLNTRFPTLVSHFPAPNPDQSAKTPSFSSQQNNKCAILSLQNSKESATRCPQQSSECVTRCLQHNDELAACSPQQLFIDVSTELLRRGQSVRFRAPGLSMHPAIKEGEIITVVPISSLDIKRGDILLYLAGRKVVAHRVVSIKSEKNDPTSHPAASSSTQSSTQSPSHFSANFAIQPTSNSSAYFSTQSLIQSTAHSTVNSSTHLSIQASTQSKALNPQLVFILRGDASAACDDPVETQQILGKVASVEKRGRSIDLNSRRAKMLHFVHARASRLKRLILRILG